MHATLTDRDFLIRRPITWADTAIVSAQVSCKIGSACRKLPAFFVARSFAMRWNCSVFIRRVTPDHA